MPVVTLHANLWVNHKTIIWRISHLSGHSSRQWDPARILQRSGGIVETWWPQSNLYIRFIVGKFAFTLHKNTFAHLGWNLFIVISCLKNQPSYLRWCTSLSTGTTEATSSRAPELLRKLVPDQPLAPMLILHGEIFVFVIVDRTVVLVL